MQYRLAEPVNWNNSVSNILHNTSSDKVIKATNIRLDFIQNHKNMHMWMASLHGIHEAVEKVFLKLEKSAKE